MISPDLLAILRCPATGSPLTVVQGGLANADGLVYPVVQGVPVLLTARDDRTLWVAAASYDAARDAARPADDFYEDTLGVLPEHLEALRARLRDPAGSAGGADPVISFLVRATCGFMYQEQVGALQEAPIPESRLAPGRGGLVLDIGCNWGRWCVAAARRGWKPVGIDPSLGGVLAAKRLCASLGVEAQFVVADARELPFADGAFDAIFSYSVLQHLSEENAELSVRESARVARPGADLLIQMPNAFGIRCLYHQARRRFRAARDFEVRYYSPGALRRLFRSFGEPSLEVDGFFGLGIQPSDRARLPPAKRLIIDCSEALRKVSGWIPPVRYAADSLYVRSTRFDSPGGHS